MSMLLLALPPQLLEKPIALVWIGRRVPLLGSEQDLRLNFKDRLLLSATLMAVRVVWRYIDLVATQRIKELNSLSENLARIEPVQLTLTDYRMLRNWKDGIEDQLAQLNDLADDRFTGTSKFDNMLRQYDQLLDRYRSAYSTQVQILHHLFKQLDSYPSAVTKGFKSITEDELWKGRSRAYDYLA